MSARAGRSTRARFRRLGRVPKRKRSDARQPRTAPRKKRTGRIFFGPSASTLPVLLGAVLWFVWGLRGQLPSPTMFRAQNRVRGEGPAAKCRLPPPTDWESSAELGSLGPVPVPSPPSCSSLCAAVQQLLMAAEFVWDRTDLGCWETGPGREYANLWSEHSFYPIAGSLHLASVSVPSHLSNRTYHDRVSRR